MCLPQRHTHTHIAMQELLLFSLSISFVLLRVAYSLCSSIAASVLCLRCAGTSIHPHSFTKSKHFTELKFGLSVCRMKHRACRMCLLLELYVAL